MRQLVLIPAIPVHHPYFASKFVATAPIRSEINPAAEQRRAAKMLNEIARELMSGPRRASRIERIGQPVEQHLRRLDVGLPHVVNVAVKHEQAILRRGVTEHQM